MTTKFGNTLALCASLVLASCGGGSDGSSVGSGVDGGNGSGKDGPTVIPTSYWTMDAFTYRNGGYSAQSTSAVAGKPLTVAVVSTATLAGGDKGNGAYSGSALTFSFLGTTPGTYVTVANRNQLVAADPADHPMLVESQVGVAVTTGSTLYAATAGQPVSVTQGSEGKYHFSTSAALTTTTTLQLLGGVAGAPAAMGLGIHDAF